MNCPHGDPLCPCPDGLACHYEGAPNATDPAHRPMPCPRLHVATHECDDCGVRTFSVVPGTDPPVIFEAGTPHCHVEACGWYEGNGVLCGPVRSGIAGQVTTGDAYDLGCGVIRHLVAHASTTTDALDP